MLLERAGWRFEGTHHRGKVSSMPPPPPGLADHFVPPSGGKHPFVEPLPGVAERCLEALTLTGPEAIERDREVLDADT